MGKVSLLTLGCPKNVVDSERLLRRLRERGVACSPEPGDAEILIVNTCGFIESAKRESIDEILKLSALKEEGRGRRLLVCGCLAERYGEELRKEIPEIDALWGVGQEERIAEYCAAHLDAGPGGEPSGEESGAPYAYLKIAEGCDRRCTYCVIPSIRGPFRSTDPDEILREASDLVHSGKKELILVAQDATSYGKERKGYDLSRLVRDMAGISGDFWIRLLYLYPTAITDRLLEAIAGEPKVCKYIDMPLQHAEKKILSLMGRGGDRGSLSRLITRIREMIPEVCLRTTMITGFPQETAADFRTMRDFVMEVGFERLGVFPYSREEGTPASSLKGQIPGRVRQERADILMREQAAVSLAKNRELVGRTFRVLVDDADGSGAIARLPTQAPEIDGVVLVRAGAHLKGHFVNVRIEKAFDYDLEGTALE